MNPQDLIGHDVYDPEGERIGRVGAVWVDGVTREPEWVTVGTGPLGGRETFVPLRGASSDHSGLRVGVRLSAVRDAPTAPLPDGTAAELFRHYGLPDAPAPVPARRGPTPSDMPRRRVR